MYFKKRTKKHTFKEFDKDNFRDFFISFRSCKAFCDLFKFAIRSRHCRAERRCPRIAQFELIISLNKDL